MDGEQDMGLYARSRSNATHRVVGKLRGHVTGIRGDNIVGVLAPRLEYGPARVTEGMSGW